MDAADLAADLDGAKVTWPEGSSLKFFRSPGGWDENRARPKAGFWRTDNNRPDSNGGEWAAAACPKDKPVRQSSNKSGIEMTWRQGPRLNVRIALFPCVFRGRPLQVRTTKELFFAPGTKPPEIQANWG